MASDRLARQLLNMTTDPNVADPVKLAAIKDALDRSGLAAKNAVSVEVGISKPFERVFDSIAAGPREPTTHTALADESDTPAIESGSDNEILGEFDDDPLPVIGDYPPGIQRERESAEIIDVEVEAIDPAGYTDTAMTTGSGTTHARSRSNRPQRRSWLDTGTARYARTCG
jgi:hypothetical protein